MLHLVLAACHLTSSCPLLIDILVPPHHSSQLVLFCPRIRTSSSPLHLVLPPCPRPRVLRPVLALCLASAPCSCPFSLFSHLGLVPSLCHRIHPMHSSYAVLDLCPR
ncbi:hypothetical protein HYPSUDRAFT_86062, partial [Hypholoma sublateritium FD-334 SS-4]